MSPNWVVLMYLVLWGGTIGVAAVLASAEVILRAYTLLTGWPVASLAEWLVGTTVAALGVLPWPGILALARALLRPKTLPPFEVHSKPVGPAIVVLPALDEEQGIQHVVSSFLATPGVGSVIVVDNGSNDRTRELALSAGARVVTEPARGYGHACFRALSEGLQSGYPVIVLAEADGTFRAEDLEKLTAYLKHADMVLGSRTHGFLLNDNSQLNPFLALGNLFVAKLLQFRYWDWRTGGRVHLTDVGCTYRVIRAEALGRILPMLHVGGDHFGPNMVMVALEHGLRVVEVPVTFWKRVGVSKGGNANWRRAFKLGLVMIWHIITYRLRRVPPGTVKVDDASYVSAHSR